MSMPKHAKQMTESIKHLKETLGCKAGACRCCDQAYDRSFEVYAMLVYRAGNRQTSLIKADTLKKGLSAFLKLIYRMFVMIDEANNPVDQPACHVYVSQNATGSYLCLYFPFLQFAAL